MAKIADIIKYEGDNSTFVWKHPCEDFNTTTQLIVHESQEAILFLNGQALDLFGPVDTRWKRKIFHCCAGLSISLQVANRLSTVKFISLTKPSKWQFAGEQTAKYSM